MACLIREVVRRGAVRVPARSAPVAAAARASFQLCIAREAVAPLPQRCALHTRAQRTLASETGNQDSSVLDTVVNVDMESLEQARDNLDWLSHPDFEDPHQFAHHYKDVLAECGADELIAKAFHASFASQAELTKLRVQQAMHMVEGRDGNTGSTAAQVAALTARIQSLIPHFRQHPKDNHGRRGLLAMVQKRRKLLQHLKRKDFQRYLEVLEMFKIRAVAGLR